MFIRGFNLGLIAAAFLLLVACQTDDPAAPASPTVTLLLTRTLSEPSVSPIATQPTPTPVYTPILLADNVPPPRPQTVTSSPIPSPTRTAFPTRLPTATLTPLAVNGVPLEQFIILPPAAIARSQEIFAQGQSRGRNPNAFSKLGDSTVLNPQLLGLFDNPNRYTLGQFSYLQPTITHFAGSFARYGVAARHGLHSWSVFDPLWANKEWCETGEHLLACEIRLNNPTLIIIRLGSNDAGVPAGFAKNVRDVVEYCQAVGVIPLLATKADRFEGDNSNNEIIRQIATDYAVPLWDFDRVADTLPNRGLAEDQVHLATVTYHDYTVPETFTSGHSMQDLTGLMVLDAIRQLIMAPSP